MTGSVVIAGNLEEAVQNLAAGARAVAGGTDLVVGARQGKPPLPESLVAIHKLEELRRLTEDGDGLRMGALVSHAEIAAHPVVRSRYTALADASAIVGSHATRAFGTIGGNLMNASPAMETGGPLLCFGSTVTLRSTKGTRNVSLDELFAGPGRTIAGADELLEEVHVPPPAPGTGSAYVRLEYRRQMEIAVVGATAVLRVEEGRVAEAQVAITALAPTIRRVPESEAALVGSDAGSEAVEAAAQAVAAASEPISDVRGSAAYRSAMAEVIGRRAIRAAAARALGEDVAVPATQSYMEV